MRKIIPLIVLMLFSVLFTMAQNINQAEADKALQLVDANKASIGLAADVRSNFSVSSTFEDQVTGMRYVYLIQSYKGIPVFNQMLVLSFKNGQLSSKSGIFDPGIEKTVNVQSGLAAVTAESAVQSALSDRGFRVSQMAIAINRKDQGRFVEFGNMGISQENITAQLMWVPVEDFKPSAPVSKPAATDVNNKTVGSESVIGYKLAWQVYIIPKTTSDYWLVRVNAADNSILGSTNLTDYDNWGTPDDPSVIKYPAFAMGKSPIGEDSKNLFDFRSAKVNDDPSVVSAATYRVIPIPFEAPSFMPGASTTWHAVRSNPWTNATVANATTLNWHTGAAATDYDYSRGNNVWAYEDRAQANTGSVASSASSQTPLPTLTFDFVPDYTQEPTVNTVAVPNQRFNITNLFYWNNLIHDIFYGYGFTEAGGNFQDDNLGRGGAGNDHVNAEAQDGLGFNNANFSTPADGGSGRMQMYLWNAPNPDRDGDVDNGIIIHEHGHGIAKRVTGGPANTGCLSNSEQGGEGISDYFGLMLTQDWTTATVNTGFNSPRGIGTYALNQPTTGVGIRPQRYCTDFAINNATYATLPSQVIPHGVGWVWCSMMWEVTWEIIKEANTITPNIYDWNGTGGNVRALRIIMEGLRTQPCSPGFVDARDNILRADTTLFGGIYGCAIWRAFARRGVGFSAQQGSVNSITDQTPAFDLPPACILAGPTVTINQAAAQPDPTSVSPINFTVVFSEAVTGFATGDVTLGGTAAATTQVVTGGPTTYNVAVSGMTMGGSVTATIAAGVCTSVALNEPNNASTSTDNSVTFLMAPAGTCTTFVSNITAADPPTSLRANRNGIVKTCAAPGTCLAGIAGSFNYQIFQWTNPVAQCVTVRYSATTASFGFVTVHNAPPVITNTCTNWVSDPGSSATVGTPIDFSFNGTAGTTYYFLVTSVGVAPVGCTLDVMAANCSAPANNPNVIINQAAAQPDPTANSPINFTAVFDQPVIGFATGDVTLSGTAGATLATVTGGPTTYNIAVTGMSSSGTVIASIAAGVCTNAALDPNNASTSTDNTVTFNLVLGCTTVDPVPSDTLCNGSTHAAVVFTSPTVGTIFNWTNSNTSIGLAASGTGNLPSFVATNTGTAPAVATITVTPQLNGPIIQTGSLLAGDLTMPQRLNRDGGAAPTCAAPRAFPGTFGSGGYRYDTYTFTNTSAVTSCVSVNLTTTDVVNANIQMASFLGTFDPNNLATNYIADPHTSTGIPAAPAGLSYSYNLAAGATTVIVVFSTNVSTGGSSTANDYTLTVDGVSCTGNPRTFTITVNPTGQVNAVPNQSVCKGSPTTPVNFTSTVPGTAFTWTNTTPAIGLAAAGNGNIPSFIAQNPGSTPLVATITVTPRFGTGGLMVTQNFTYTGAVQTWVVPAGVTSVNIKTWGGQGNSNAAASSVGGLGGYAEGALAVTPGQTLYINAGGGAATATAGGFNGGGIAGANAGCANAQGGGGGGASDVRVGANTLAARVIVAGGGGGAGGNRVTGCGRGAGGGGGAGYYGGGGGAGWPGVPGSQGPVPTGGTQSAGGAGGVTTFTPGPTNGFPGVIGVGGAGGTEVGSAQGGVANAEPGGVGGGLTGGSGLYNQANNWCGQSGAGGSSYIGGVTAGLTTQGVQSGNGRVEISYAAGGVSCIGTPVTFTITVNPNPGLIIVADPGTTLCEGDPTLLTVYDAGSGITPVALTQSSSQTPVAGSVSCNAGGLHTDNSYWRAYNLAPLGLPSALTVTNVTFGIELAAGGAQPVTVNLYTQNAGPAFPGGTRTLVGSQAGTVNNTTLSLFTVNFATPVVVPSSAVLIVELFTPSGQATGRSFFIGSNPAAQTGTSYLSAATCGITTPTDVAAIGFPNMHIILNVGGTVGAAGPIATGTFLWSPAAGLSSTTSNPVAASPMNTTTYTVRRTTAAGCKDSAQVTITVNKRPTVTTHPVNAVVCQTLATSFTVAGTGTALTYQWQENTAGCTGGTWANLVNGGPYSGVTTPTLNINPVSGLMNGYGYRCVLSGICAPILTNNISNCATLKVNPLPVVVITPRDTCGGVAGVYGVALSVGSAPPPVPGSCTTSSGAISIAVPDNTANGAQATLAVSCVPANATVTGIRVNLNMPGHTFVGDMIFNLKAPNGAILNLDKYMSATATQAGAYPNSGFVNTTISSSGTAALGGATTTPITGTWKADLINGTVPFVVQDPAGFVSTATAWSQLFSVPNGTWTLAMADGGPGDVGTLTSWSVTVEYTTPGTTGSTNTYVWSPLAGLYNDALATSPYTGTNAIVVYAAPTVFTTYTVVATNTVTGCIDSAKANVNYTPPAPLVTPNPVAMCLGDPSVRLVASTATPFTKSVTSGPINIPIPDETATPTLNVLNVSGIPTGATITSMVVTLNMPHTYPADMVFNLKAPNGQILSLYKHNTNTDNGAATIPNAGFYNAKVSSLSNVQFVAVPFPYRYGETLPAGPYKADALNGVVSAGYVIMDPTGYASNAAGFSSLYSVPNGSYTLAMCDGGPGDFGTLLSWSIDINYVVGVPATPSTWSPITHLWNDSLRTQPYIGDARDTVWTRPTPAGVYNYTVTAQSLPLSGTIPLPAQATTLAGNVRGYWFTAPSSFFITSLQVPTDASTGTQNIAVLRFTGATPPPAFPGTTNAFTTLFLTQNNPAAGAIPVNIQVNTGDVIGILGNRGNVNSYTTNGPIPTVINGATVPLTRMGMQLPLATNAPQNIWQEAAFQISRVFFTYGLPTPQCTSPARTVVVTVNNPTQVTTQPVDQTICTDKVATFSVVAGGTGPFSYQWQVSTNGNNPASYINITNGGVYSGATTATLTITAPPVTLNGNFYRCIVTGAAPCKTDTSFGRRLTVNPLPIIVIKADPYTSLFPGLRTTLSSIVSPNAAASYRWVRDGVNVPAPAGTNATLQVDIDGLGDYQLTVTDVNGCTNKSNIVTIRDSATAKCYIYPNPTSGIFQVRYYSVANNVQLPRTLTVYDAKGDRVYTKMYSIGRPYDRMDVDMRAYGKGLYWVEIGDRNGNRLTMCRVVIQ